jgi:two-component system, NarL family, nitrate/nitrite response regulator NarL
MLTPPAREPQGHRVRVLMADSQPLFRDSLARAVEQRRSLEVVAELGEADALPAALERTRPDVAVIDDALLDGTRLDAATARVVLLGGKPESARAFAAIEGGAAGYLSRDSSADALCDAILRAASGDIVLDPAAQTGVSREIRLRTRSRRPRLSPREREILQLIAKGLTAPQIGRRLQIGTGTVKTHMLHLYDKLGVSERAAAVLEGMRQGLLE